MTRIESGQPEENMILKVITLAPVNVHGAKLQEVISRVVPADRVVQCQTLDAFRSLLRHLSPGSLIAVVLTDTKEELGQILSIRHLLQDVRTILVLPDQDPESVAQGHNLRPRFVSYADGDLEDVAAVLGKMVAGAGAEKGFGWAPLSMTARGVGLR